MAAFTVYKFEESNAEKQQPCNCSLKNTLLSESSLKGFLYEGIPSNFEISKLLVGKSIASFSGAFQIMIF